MPRHWQLRSLSGAEVMRPYPWKWPELPALKMSTTWSDLSQASFSTWVFCLVVAHMPARMETWMLAIDRDLTTKNFIFAFSPGGGVRPGSLGCLRAQARSGHAAPRPQGSAAARLFSSAASSAPPPGGSPAASALGGASAAASWASSLRPSAACAPSAPFLGGGPSFPSGAAAAPPAAGRASAAPETAGFFAGGSMSDGLPSLTISSTTLRTKAICSAVGALPSMPGRTWMYRGSLLSAPPQPTPRSCKRQPVFCIMKRMWDAPTPSTALYAAVCLSSSLAPGNVAKGTTTLVGSTYFSGAGVGWSCGLRMSASPCAYMQASPRGHSFVLCHSLHSLVFSRSGSLWNSSTSGVVGVFSPQRSRRLRPPMGVLSSFLMASSAFAASSNSAKPNPREAGAAPGVPPAGW
mmetsp:Transcript_106548/g.297337  ORF Transcript_106548/g.297337 Transcript_106548/m.297337 type:complete len:407 (+) Transcript_106548:242-1462(+)